MCGPMTVFFSTIDYTTCVTVYHVTLSSALYVQECTAKFIFTNIFPRKRISNFLNPFFQMTTVRKDLATFGNLRLVECVQ